MVRPVEEESDLHNLQSLPDTVLRDEFVQQMGQLRAKVFKRVRPKMLHGKQITGETLLELTEAYVLAINKGSVPCIESAWSYICKNECDRAFKAALFLYKQNIQSLSLNEQTLASLKSHSKEAKTLALKLFKDKAIDFSANDIEGEDKSLGDFEEKLE